MMMMQRLLRTTVIVFGCFTVHANDTQHKFTIGIDAMRYKYEESTDQKPKFMASRSNQFGLYGAYTFTCDQWFIKPENTINYGWSKYTNSRSPIYPASEPVWLFEGRLLGGYDFNVLDDLTLSPYIGIGYKHRSEDNQMTNSPDNGKENDTMRSLRVNRSFYIPVGVKVNYDFTPQWFVNGTLEYAHRIWGIHYHYAKQIAPSPHLYKQHKAWGIKAELMLGKHNDKNTVEFGPFFNYWKAKKSNKLYYKSYIRNEMGGESEWQSHAYEPKNTIKEFGFRVKVTF